MSDERKKVKDLATELNLQTKDILAAAKELGIGTAKVAASSLSETEFARLRGHFVPAPGSDKQEVIVRRRRKAADESGALEAESPAVPGAHSAQNAPAAPVADAPVTAASVSDAPKVLAEPVAAAPVADAPVSDAPKVLAEPVAASSAPARPQAPAAAALPEKKKPAGARVLHRPGDEPAAPVAVEAPATSAPTVVEPAADAKPVADAKPAADAKPVAQVREAAPKGAEKAKPAEKEVDPKKTFARVVRPAAFSAEPERNAEGETISSAPARPPKSETGDYSEDDDKRRDAGDGSSQVRVISRPSPQQPAPAGRPRPAGHEGQRPPAGARPPRPADGGRPGGDREGYAPRPAGTGYAPRPAGTGYAPRPAGTGYAPRPAGTGYPPRPGGGAGAGAPRPGGFSTPRPAGAGAPGGFAPAGAEGEQGRKKRQKGRRTTEFGGATRARSGEEDFGWSKSSRRKGRKPRDAAPMGGTQAVKAVKRKIKVDEFIRVSDLAHQMQLKSGEIIKVLFGLGVMATINQSLDIDTASLVAAEFDYEIEKVGFSEEEVLVAQQEVDSPEDLITRPPVVTIMGHVDHGKTSLLDAIRKSSVVTGEAGGITQHIGAYHVKTKKGEIVFLDTPGHEAFTAMRARGAEVTDIVVLVVAADDGVMEQTKEAISHARAAKVPIMVAVNKMDKESANPERVKRELADQGLVAEDWGGDTTFSYVSAKTRLGLDDLLELLALQAEILELKANPKKAAVGHIVEAKLDKGRGSLGTVLIQEGTLRLGDTFVCGVHSGKVRAMFNDQGKKVKEAGPSMPVEVQGFEGVPEAGEEFVCLADDKTARRIAEARALKQRERELAKESKVTLETFLASKADSVEAQVLNLVVKSDVQGSLEAITDALRKLSTEKVRINVIHGGTGAISESDVLLSTASSAIIIGFNVRPTTKAKDLAEQEKVDIRFYDIIYKLVEEIKSAMEGMLAPVSREVFLGTADVRETFSVPKVGLVAGCHVSDGKMLRNAQSRLLRNGIVIHTGKIGSLRRFKDDVREVAKGYECGIGLENYNDVKVGDVIEAFEMVEEAATL